MVRSMAKNPIVFALANPDPEIAYELAMAARPDAIVATGRSDYPNQVNNVLGFPFIFRGALDVRATTINDEMKLAATHALAALAKEDVPDSVRRAYGVERLEFGREYLIPKPFDPRVLVWEASAVAEAAIRTGVAQQVLDIDEYREQLERRLGKAREVMRIMINKAQRRAQAHRVPGGRGRQRFCAPARFWWTRRLRCPILLGKEARDPRADGGAAPARGLGADCGSGHGARSCGLRRRALRAAAAQGRDAARSHRRWR